jgi:hypothetical protein
MGKLRPIGSEKLQGMDAIRRMIEISNYNLNIPKPINETHSFDYKKTLADNETYFIVKEKVGYVIKKGLNESTSEYIDPMKNRKFYPSYSQALKRLNIITKEVNSIEGYEHNISLFEGDSEEKYYLTLDEQPQQQQQRPAPQPAPQQPAPAPQPAQAPQGSPEGDMGGEDMGMDDMPMDDMGDEDMPMDDMGMDENPEDDDEQVTIKVLQKYTGKLAQKVRQFLQDEENQLTSQDVLYILNSVISALPIDNLEAEDKEKVMSKFEGGETEYELEVDDEQGMMGDEEGMMGDEEGMMGDEEGMMGGQSAPQTPPRQPQGEMGEDFPMGRDARSMKNRQSFNRQSLYSESKIDKVLSNYFIPKTTNKKSNTIQKISESYEQEDSAHRFLNKYPKAKLLGKDTKGQLVFEMYNERFYISPNGNVK